MDNRYLFDDIEINEETSDLDLMLSTSQADFSPKQMLSQFEGLQTFQTYES